MRRVVLIIFTLILFGMETKAATINASSCSRNDVEAAINSATDGDIVLIPSGSSTWTTTITIDPMPAITIKGAGIDQTVITDNTGTAWNEPLF